MFVIKSYIMVNTKINKLYNKSNINDLLPTANYWMIIDVIKPTGVVLIYFKLCYWLLIVLIKSSETCQQKQHELHELNTCSKSLFQAI